MTDESLDGLRHSLDEVDVSVVGTEVLIRQNRSVFEDWEWRRMVEFGIFPVREKNDTLDGAVRWTIASFDPMRRSVDQFVKSQVRGPVIIRFAPPAVVFDLVSRCTAFSKLDALPWYRKYVLGRLPIPLRPFPDTAERRRAA